MHSCFCTMNKNLHFRGSFFIYLTGFLTLLSPKLGSLAAMSSLLIIQCVQLPNFLDITRVSSVEIQTLFKKSSSLLKNLDSVALFSFGFHIVTLQLLPFHHKIDQTHLNGNCYCYLSTHQDELKCSLLKINLCKLASRIYQELIGPIISTRTNLF